MSQKEMQEILNKLEESKRLKEMIEGMSYEEYLERAEKEEQKRINKDKN
jgi:hypothetical protein